MYMANVTPNARGPNETYILPARIGLALGPWGFMLGPQGFIGFSGCIVVEYRLYIALGIFQIIVSPIKTVFVKMIPNVSHPHEISI